MKKIVFLASGGGGNMKFFHQAILFGKIANVQLDIIADRECGSIEYAARHGINYHVIHYNKSTPNILNQLLETKSPDIIVTNWHKIIDANTIRRFDNKLINLHYSLLPAFSGLIGIEPIKQAYKQGCKFIGPTCHIVDAGVDTGKILAQAVFATNCPLEEAVNIMFRKGCFILLNGIQIMLQEKIIVNTSASNDTYSPKLNFNEDHFNEVFWCEVANK